MRAHLQSGEVEKTNIVAMNGETSTGLHPGRKKRRRDRHGEPSRGKPVSKKWKPVWLWLQSLKRTEVVEPAEVIAWLDSNPEYAAEIRQHHTNGVFVAYAQKCHQRLIYGQYHNKIETKKNRVSRPMRPPRLDDTDHSNGQVGPKESSQKGQQDVFQLPWNQQLAHNVLGNTKFEHGEDEGSVLDPQTWREHWRNLLDIKKMGSEIETNAEENHEQRHTSSPYSTRIKRQREFYTPDDPGKRVQTQKEIEPNLEPLDKMDTLTKFELILTLEMRLKEIVCNSKSQPVEANGFSKADKQKLDDGARPGRKSRSSSDTAAKAWVFSEACTGQETATPNIIESLIEREQGANSGAVAYRPNEIGNRGMRWKAAVNGWDSLEKQRLGPTNWLQKRAYSSWRTTWCAYTSSSAVAHPLGGTRMDQGVQKVLDVRFHPGGDPLLVVSCNEPPNELLLYDLENGRGKPLTGLNTQIQAVEFASNGACIVACASNIVKVWDTVSCVCSHTLGPGLEDDTSGHKKKINAMSVNQFRPYLIATSGGDGDNQILLWNVRSGELATDLNASYRQHEANLLSMDALKFSSDRFLICGSDSPGGEPAIMQIWDIDAAVNVSTYPAHDTYITCLDVNLSGSTILTGSGDGSVGLFDVRTSGAIARLPLTSNWEVTSVSFSPCETYFQASCTGNCTFVWDTRMMPLETGVKCVERPPPVIKDRAFKALHRLSHGNPMPTSENSFQVPGVVDVGDQGVNDAKWFQDEAILVTASGSGSVAMWDPALGQPCVQHFKSHTRCVNTVAVSLKDQFICTGGDDQKVVLYQNVREQALSPRWRLTYPLNEDSL